MPKVVILDGGYESYEYEETLLKKHGLDCMHYPGPADDLLQKKEFCRDAVGILVRGTVIDAEFMRACPDLMAIVRYGVGYDNIDIQAATAQNIRVANVQGYANHSVSDHAIALLYACLRMLPTGIKTIQENFSRPPVADMFELHDKTIGIIGLGRIGKTFYAKVRHLCERVLVYDPYIDQSEITKYGAIAVQLDELLAKSHVISLHCDLNESSHHLLNEKAFAKMAKRPIVINTARGGVIDYDALLTALNDNIIHSAGLDVYQHEAITEEEQALVKHPRIVATGHYAWYSDRASQILQNRAVENLVKLLEGKTVEDCLNP